MITKNVIWTAKAKQKNIRYEFTGLNYEIKERIEMKWNEMKN